MDWLIVIRDCFDSDAVLYSRHARFEMENEEFGKILEHEVFEAIKSGEIIEKYPEGKPYPSVLIFGRAITGRPLHIVCAYIETDNLVIVVTVYHPDKELWTDFRRRKKT